MGKAQFFCEECGAEVRMQAAKCPECGKKFAAVKCPKCGYIGQPPEFKSGCPVCGYKEKQAEVPRPADAQKGRAPSGREVRAAKGLSAAFYSVIGFLLLAALIVLIILYLRIF